MQCFLQWWRWQGVYCGYAPPTQQSSNGKRWWEENESLSCCKSRMKETKWERRCFPNENSAAVLENCGALRSLNSLFKIHRFWCDMKNTASTKLHFKSLGHFTFVLNADVNTYISFSIYLQIMNMYGREQQQQLTFTLILHVWNVQAVV